uniref:CX domain-containing protein n=1 Tax=Syphacia muris TaxID=451379 RepID=A0A0N5AL82_9BILA
MASRWSNLPYSEQEQLYLAQTTTTRLPIAAIAPIRRSIGAFFKQEISDKDCKVMQSASNITVLDDDQILCYYKNVANDSLIPYVCELGCCPHGCCTIQEMSKFVFCLSSSYGWAIGLFLLLIFIIILTFLALFTVCYINRQKNRQIRQNALNSIDESISGSQVSCPASYYGQEGYYPYVTDVKAY